ncbi:protein mab-21-like [Ptychodera flava]|uniref:protein mab-21-like n=1 Tax=Ptychodera flava TaxID=63121 RepID=UPI003969EF52
MASSKRYDVMKINKALCRYADKVVYPNEKKTKRAQAFIINRVVNPILEEIGNLDDRFRSEKVKADGCYVGLMKTGGWDFDVLICLNNLLKCKVVGDFPDKEPAMFIDSNNCDNPYLTGVPGFGYVATDPNLTFIHGLYSPNNVPVDTTQYFPCERYLSPQKVLKQYCYLAEQAVGSLEEECFWEQMPTVYGVDVDIFGPTVQLTILMEGETFNVHLVPSIKFPEFPDSAKAWGRRTERNDWLSKEKVDQIKESFYVFPNKAPEDTDPTRLWCCFYLAKEVELAKTADKGQPDACRVLVEQIMSTLCEENCEDFHPINRRIIRTVFLQQCVQFPHAYTWAIEKIAYAFIDMFEALLDSLAFASCPHAFLPETNLLGSYKPKELRRVAEHLQAILHDIVSRPMKTKFLV